MTVRVGINGFGRIGRSFYRAILERGEQAQLQLAAVNDPFGDADTMAFLLKHDSVGGTLPQEVKVVDGGFEVAGQPVKKLEVREPSEIPWGGEGVDVVIESTGLFTARDKGVEPVGADVADARGAEPDPAKLAAALASLLQRRAEPHR